MSPCGCVERQAAVDEHEARHESWMPRGEDRRDERAHGVRDDDDRVEVQCSADRREVVGVACETGRPLEGVAAAASPQVGGDDPHPRQGVGEQLPGMVR